MVWKFNQRSLRSYSVFDFPHLMRVKLLFLGTLLGIFMIFLPIYMEKLILDISRYEKVTLVTLGVGGGVSKSDIK